MQHEADRDIRSTVARVAGALIGLGLVLAIIAPFDGVPPRPGTDELAPAQIEVRVLANAVFVIDPIGPVLEPTNFPPPGKRGGPSVSVKVRNFSSLPVRIRVRLVGLTSTLGRAVKVRGSVAGSVVLNGPLERAAEWSRPSGVLQSGESTTLRMRFKLLALPPSEWRGRLDVRQLEFDGVRLDGTSGSTTVPQSTPGVPPTSSTIPPATTPAPKLGPPLPGTTTVMGTVMESATDNLAQNGSVGPTASTPPETTP